MIAIPFSFGSIAGLMILATAAGIPAAVIFLLTVVAHAAFFHYLKRPTLLGRQTLDEIEGFHEYLSVAEEERLNLLNPPGRTPELFERFLPYAFALNCEQQWSRAFDAILAQAAQEPGQRGTTYRPAWYSGDTGAFSASSFSDQLSSSFAGAVSSASTAPGTSSGSSGGGSSGGGGGGGGGGGW
jgi:uncharacterized membrane protein YgcG